MAERELARRGIGCYFTTKKSIIKKMVYRGIALRKALEGLGFKVIEVYPYATKRCLWGKDIPRKSSPQGREFFRGILLALVPSLQFFHQQHSHDLVDAALAAYTVYLACRGEGEELGDPREGQIVVPLTIPPFSGSPFLREVKGLPEPFLKEPPWHQRVSGEGMGTLRIPKKGSHETR